jgi:hypothetical protein
VPTGYDEEKAMILTWIYWAICLFMVVLVLRSLYREKSLREQWVAAMVLVPLLLRVLMIK